MNIRFATAADEERIVDFIRENWKGNQTLVNSREIFRYQYMTHTECGFVLAEEEGKLFGIKGYVPLNSSERPDVTAALAITLKSSHPMLNMEIQRFMEQGTNCRMMCSPGLNPNTAARVYPLFHYKVDKLQQYYILSDTDDYRIAHIEHRPVTEPRGDARLVYLPDLSDMCKNFDPEAYTALRPYKDISYLRYRYYDHPFYHYQVYGVFTQADKASSLMIGREIVVEGRKVFRIVDWIGVRENVAQIGQALQQLLQEKGYEYIDFYCYGFSHEDMTRSGFTLRTENDTNIIPNYFEPFIQKNVDIIFFCNLHDHFILCKADGDQDRPNVIA